MSNPEIYLAVTFACGLLQTGLLVRVLWELHGLRRQIPNIVIHLELGRAVLT